MGVSYIPLSASRVPSSGHQGPEAGAPGSREEGTQPAVITGLFPEAPTAGPAGQGTSCVRPRTLPPPAPLASPWHLLSTASPASREALQAGGLHSCHLCGYLPPTWIVSFLGSEGLKSRPVCASHPPPPWARPAARGPLVGAGSLTPCAPCAPGPP